MNQDKRNVGTSIKNEYKNFFYVNALKDYVYLNQYVGKKVKVVYNRENAEIIRAGILEKLHILEAFKWHQAKFLFFLRLLHIFYLLLTLNRKR